MRLRLRLPLRPQELARLTPHEIVRDFPETLSVFRAHDVSLRAAGARPVSRDPVAAKAGAADSGGDLLRALVRACEWRDGEA